MFEFYIDFILGIIKSKTDNIIQNTLLCRNLGDSMSYILVSKIHLQGRMI